MKALVTGATGFVGSHITRQLIDAGHSVRALYRSEAKLRQLAGLDLEAVPGDLDDSARLERASAGCEVVFHVAAKADYWKDDDRDALWRVNVEGTRNLLAAAKVAGVRRVVFTSSASTVGILPGEQIADETTPFNLPPARFWYAYTKLKAEAVAAEFVAAGLDVVTLNPVVIVGPGDLNAISGSFIIETARLQWLLPQSSGGISVIDARDVARAHLAACERGRAGERYILSAANLSYREWFGMIAAACDVRPPLALHAGLAAGTDGAPDRIAALARHSDADWTPIRHGWAAPAYISTPAKRSASWARRRSTWRPACAILSTGISSAAILRTIGWRG